MYNMSEKQASVKTMSIEKEKVFQMNSAGSQFLSMDLKATILEMEARLFGLMQNNVRHYV